MNTPDLEEPEKSEKDEEPERGEVTLLLEDWNNGDTGARDRLLSLVYGELRRMAHRRLMGERDGHTMLTGTLAGEVYLRLSKAKGIACHNRKEFFSIVARQMRQVLVDTARKRDSQMRGGGQVHLPLEDSTVVAPPLDLNLIALDEALEALAKYDDELSRIVDLRYFGELTIEQTAEILDVSVDTVKRRWQRARVYLYEALTLAG